MNLAKVLSRNRRWLMRASQMLATLLLLYLILRGCSYEQFLQIRESIKPAYLFATVGLSLLAMAAGSVSLLLLFELSNRWAWWWTFLFDYFYVQAICLLTPAQMGEASLPYIAGRSRFAPGEIAAALLVQRMVALLTLVAFAMAGAGAWVSSAYLSLAALVIALSCAAVAALIANGHIRERLSQVIGRRFGPILYGFYDAWRAILLERRRRLVLHLVVMQLRYLLAVGSTYALLAGFDIRVPFGELASLTALASLAALVPVTINGVGVTEGIFVLALGSYGFGAAPVLAACLAGRLINALVMAGLALAHTAFNSRVGIIRHR